MIRTTAALARAQLRLTERLEQLEARLAGGDETAWSAYCEAAASLAAIAPLMVPGADGRLLSTAEMAERLGVAPKTLLRRKAKGEVMPAVQLGQRGRAALRWAAR